MFLTHKLEVGYKYWISLECGVDLSIINLGVCFVYKFILWFYALYRSFLMFMGIN